MANFEVKVEQPDFGNITNKSLKVFLHLDLGFKPGDKVKFIETVEGKPKKALTVTLGYADQFKPFDLYGGYADDFLEQYGVTLLGLTHAGSSILVRPSTMRFLKAQSDTFERLKEGGRVDARIPDDGAFKLGTALIFQEFDSEQGYTGNTEVRGLKIKSQWWPKKYWSADELRSKGLCVLGWKGESVEL